MIDNLIHSMLVCPSYETKYPSIVKGEGIYIFDSKGKRYIDGTSGTAAVSNLGHTIPGLSDIVKEQMDSISLIPTHTFTCEQTEAYLRKLIGFASHDFVRAWTASSGTEAVEQSLKLALQYQQLIGENQRYKIVSRWGTYHGNSVFTLDVGGMKLRRSVYEKWMNNFPHIPPSYPYRRPSGMSLEEYALVSAGEFEKRILEEGPDTIAAFIAEPIVAAALGAVVPSDGYFKEIRQVCDQYGILFVADEVLTGFGRIGANFGLDRFGVQPDIIAAGKGISGGTYPLSAVIINSKVAQLFENHKMPFLGGHSYACNPVGSVIGSFVIDYMRENNVVENSFEMGNILIEKLQRLYKYDIVGDVRGIGLYVGVEFVSNKETKEPFHKDLNVSQRIVDIALDKGLVVYKGKGSYDGEVGDHITISPPLIIDQSQIEEIVSILDDSINEFMKTL
ncbi:MULTISPECIES: aminotransferase class III-fold pyridoxal phosphate-dependent enzyme [unclassified Chryseobacterium]|uniref:aminotransferase family protein n=1 Tax=unclassified Chryseobacterium TaxID=2593645 RepID=UPI000F44F2D6|nr:aminotransferase class III-fold pyridoxal phosphate-dependent enzyme [Chryseobacterium sp. G0240]ROI04074.1 aspartate aminotransferase family protein [Chryseobacterium sp. G0240]